MSMISEQVNYLRRYITNDENLYDVLHEAANTIEILSEKLAANGGWISCSERLPVIAEYMEFEPTPYMKRLEIAYMTDTVNYLIGYYDGDKWMDKHHNIIKNVIAWKTFLKLPEEYHG